MIGLDTNVLVRYITQDDAAQSPVATQLIEDLSSEHPGFVSLVAAIELVWVLQGSYNAKREEIARVLETLLRSKEFVTERSELLWQALRRFAAGNADFADCLIERSGHAAECRYTVTFDQNAASGAGMRLIAP